MTRIGPLELTYTARGLPRYRVELWHDGLNKHRIIEGPDPAVVMRKASLQAAEWLAEERTAEAQAELARLREILAHALRVNHVVDWESLKDHSPFPEPKPVMEKVERPKPEVLPSEPRRDSPEYTPKFGLLDRLIPWRRGRVLADCQARFEIDHARWEAEVQAIKAREAEAERRYQEQLKRAEEEHAKALVQWEQRRAAFLKKQQEANEAVDKQRAAYLSGNRDAVIEYCDLVLSASEYPDYFPKEYDLDYLPDGKVLIVDYALPSPDQIPTLAQVKYVKSRDEFVERHLSKSEAAKLYDDVLYQIALRTVHELFEADIAGTISTIVFNGFVTSLDRSSGKEVTACVMSLQVQRDEFASLNLSRVDPKACFKALKGVASARLHGLAPVPPILSMQKEDRRFVEAREVASTLDETVNLAAMDWEDFEHLIRELFEREFAAKDAEVKVTQASRDGGVDAVIFDPDPIHGGKIVIQAKRYTHTVGVGAVRDLYGTVLNEGANKGILVTTSDYGPDAYAFAKGKPLVLLNGANLLHLLEKHGHKARIDLQEARQLLKD